MRKFLLIIFILPFVVCAQSNDPKPRTSMDEFVTYLNKNFILNNKVIAEDLSGTIELEFRVNEFGILDSFNIVKDIGGEAAMDLIKVIKKGGNWNPALVNGKPKAAWVSLPYKVLSRTESVHNMDGSSTASPVEGIDKFRDKFLSNFKYPEAAINAGIDGSFSLQFDVNELGELKNIKLLKDPGYDIEINAIRALKRAGKWRSASKEGENISSTNKFDFTLNLKEFKRGVR